MADKTLLKRTPIVAVMGHVDHGKTTLLDSIRNTQVQASEVGGITQNTRAHQIEYKGNKITFIDTPGHEAFSNMRSRGARVTDIVLLVVAIDDGVQPQTKESIKFAKEHKVPVIVAFNKVDLPGKNSTKLKQELSNAGVQLEEYGGDVMAVEVSAIKKTGLDELLDRIILLAEMSELKVEKPQDVKSRAFILESTLDKTRGPVALCIVKSGEIESCDYMVLENNYSRIRTILDSNQKQIEKAIEGDPVWLIGLDEVYKVGSFIDIVNNEKEANELIKKDEKNNIKEVSELNDGDNEEKSDLDFLASLLTTEQKDNDIKFINIVLKADTDGTLEAVREQLLELNDDEVQVKIVKQGTGSISEDDILTAKDSKGLVIGFQVEADKHVLNVAKKERVIVRIYEIIYALTEEIADVMDSMLAPTEEIVEIAIANVKKVFTLSNGSCVAGCFVNKGTFIKGVKVFVKRDDEKVHTGKVTALRILKEEVKEVKKGSECGIMIEPNFEIKEGDEIVSFKVDKF